MTRKTVRVKFVDFYRTFDERNNMIYNCLSRYYNVEISEDPDYLVYGVTGYSNLEYPGAVRIMWTVEAVVPDFNLCDYAIGFDHIEFGDRYFRSLTWTMDVLKQLCAHERRRVDVSLLPRSKPRFCNYLYSSKSAHPDRDRFFHLIGQYKSVDSGGEHLNNMGPCSAGPRVGADWIRDSIEFREPYKFSIAFENSLHAGYTTERLPASFLADTVPIYWGNPLVGRDYNNEAMINCHEYRSFEDVVERVRELDDDEQRWRQVLSQPVFTDRTRADWCGERTALESFLCHIFDQPIECARRRGQGRWNRYCFMRARNDALLRSSRAYKLISAIWRLNARLGR